MKPCTALRIIALLSLLTSFVLMLMDIYGVLLFLCVLIGIFGMGVGAYCAEHKDSCKTDTP